MPERRHIRVSEAQDGRSERPARRYGVAPSRIAQEAGWLPETRLLLRVLLQEALELHEVFFLVGQQADA
jgi:hypothetical protein